MNNKYYTYAYLREDGTPYYIGKGKGCRINGKHHNIKVPPKERRVHLKQNLTEAEAFRHEIYMISVFGRKDLGTGILRNRTDGGEGASGRVLSEEHKKKIGLSNRGKLLGFKRTEEFKQKISKTTKGKEISAKTRKKLSNALKGNKNGQGCKGFKHTQETKDKLSKIMRKPDEEVSPHTLYAREYKKERQKYSNEEWNNIKRQKRIEIQTKTYQITFDDGRTIIVSGLRKFAKENGYSSGIFNVMNGTYKKHKDIVAVEKLDHTPLD